MISPPHSDQPLAQRILDRIEGEHLRPRPRWEFIFKNYTFWMLGALAVALGAFAFSAGLFEVENADWQLATATHGNGLEFFLAAAPFLWVVALTLFILLGYANIRRTRRGYRYPLAVIALGAVLSSVTLGTALYAAGLGGEIEEAVGDHPPFYRPILVEEKSWWLSPQKGLLGGEVVSATDGPTFVIRDFSGNIWTVNGSDLPSRDLVYVARGGTVRIVGVPAEVATTSFHACFVFPWRTYGLAKEVLPSPPLFVFSSSSEISGASERSDICKAIAPYQQLRSIEEANGL